MTDITTFDYLNSVRNSIATRAAEGCAYDKWSDEFARKEVREAWEDTSGVMRTSWDRRVTKAEFDLMTDKEKTILGFSLWNENGLRLIPLWAFNYIADGEELTSISGDVVTKGIDNIDLDVRAGCIAFGF